jgi:large subunit ribosomal protein L23
MPIFTNIFKKAGMKEPGKARKHKEQQQRERGHAPDQAKQQDPVEEHDEEKKVATPALKQERAHGAYNVLVRPHISEKSVAHSDKGRYVFEVRSGTRAGRIAQAVEETYDVEVARVSIIKVPNKKSRLRNRSGERTRYDKAVVTLKEGNQIEVLPQ